MYPLNEQLNFVDARFLMVVRRAPIMFTGSHTFIDDGHVKSDGLLKGEWLRVTWSKIHESSDGGGARGYITPTTRLCIIS